MMSITEACNISLFFEYSLRAVLKIEISELYDKRIKPTTPLKTQSSGFPSFGTTSVLPVMGNRKGREFSAPRSIITQLDLGGVKP